MERSDFELVPEQPPTLRSMPSPSQSNPELDHEHKTTQDPPSKLPRHLRHEDGSLRGLSARLSAVAESFHHQYRRHFPRRRYRASPPHPVLRFWVWELLALIAALTLLAAVFAVLASYHGKPLPELPYGISLNSLVALLAVFLRSAIIYVVVEILGQARWSWFGVSPSPSQPRPRPLSDLQKFHAAGEGLVGSLNLFRIMIGKLTRGAASSAGMLSLASALVMIASFAIGTFIQQAARTVPCRQQLKGQTAILPVASSLIGINRVLRGAQPDVGFEIRGAMIAGLTNPKGNDSNILPVCPTGNCTFPLISPGITHLSVGICSRCVDTTEFVIRNDTDKQMPGYHLPGLVYTSFITDPGAPYSTDIRFNLDSSESYAQHRWSSEFAEATPHAFVNISITTYSRPPYVDPSNGHTDDYVEYLRKFKPVAVSCTIFPCLRYYFAQVDFGKLNETVIKTQVMRQEEGIDFGYTEQANWTTLREPCMYPDGKSYTVENITSAQQWSTPGQCTAPACANVTISGPTSRNDRATVQAPSACISRLFSNTGGSLIGTF